MKLIDLRSDTATRPTPGMREAIARAEVGDEQKREDPTVNELERRVATLVGQEEAVFLPTATMANQIALRLLSEPGDELLADGWSHLFINELGGPAAHSGLVMRPLESTDGRFSAEQVREAAWDRRDTHRPITRLVSIENTNNSAGGRIWPVDEIAAVAEVCRELDLRLHMDGARLMNAAVGSGVDAAEIGGHFDTVTLCLSKGLGCPLGALVAGSAENMAKARRLKHMFGGAMRQAGIVAAAGVYALDHHVSLLADDHARARRLGEGWHAAGLPVDPDQVETNFVQLDVEPLGLSKFDVIATLKDAGVGVSNTVHPTKLRAVTHLDLSDEDIEAAVALAPEALAARV
ncbi:MAG TPA: GntG family PLP-dependent aldolase [Gaiellaceae bacterium]|nr:GntG family PLP-dependent aldolase [Gaiellaceae bacterium]